MTEVFVEQPLASPGSALHCTTYTTLHYTTLHYTGQVLASGGSTNSVVGSHTNYSTMPGRELLGVALADDEGADHPALLVPRLRDFTSSKKTLV